MVKINKNKIIKIIKNNIKEFSLYDFLQLIFIYKALKLGWTIKHISNNKFELSLKNKHKHKRKHKYNILIKHQKTSIKEFILEDLLKTKQPKSTNMNSHKLN